MLKGFVLGNNPVVVAMVIVILDCLVNSHGGGFGPSFRESLLNHSVLCDLSI